MSDPARGGGASSIVRSVIRIAVLTLLVAAPLAFGSVHRPAYIPLLVVAIASGIASWGHGHWARAHGVAVPRVPATRLLLALHGLVLLQLVPLGVPLLLRSRSWTVVVFVVLVYGVGFVLGPDDFAQHAERGMEDGRFDL